MREYNYIAAHNYTAALTSSEYNYTAALVSGLMLVDRRPSSLAIGKFENWGSPRVGP